MPQDKIKRRDRKMAGVNICDRCEAMVKGNALGDVAVTTSGEPERETLSLELCPDCIGGLVSWLETRVTPQERAYKHGWQREQDSKSDTQVTLEDAVRRAVRLELESRET
jgi:hypothetical protein